MNKLKFLFLIVLALSVFSGCSSDAPVLASVEPEPKLYNVTFDVQEFEVDSKPLRNAKGKHLVYRVYIEDEIVDGSTETIVPYYSELISEKKFTPSEFTGKIALSLPRGKYRIIAFMSETPIGNFVNMQYVLGGNPISYEASGVIYHDLKQELFRGQVDFTIQEQNSNQSLTFKRAISRINLALEDLAQIPSSVKTVVPVIYNTTGASRGIVIPHQIFLNGNSQYFYGNVDESSILDEFAYQSIAISRNDIATYGKNNPISFYFPQNKDLRFLNGGESGVHDLYLVGLDSDDVTWPSLMLNSPKIVYSKLLKKDIKLLPNQSITISGTIIQAEGIHLSVDDTWGETINENF
ncbi:MAG: hypothetical protein RL662_1554 [Bacteroidota bacterium]